MGTPAAEVVDGVVQDETEAGCSWCERGSGLILVGGALALLYIGLDLISGGKLSRLLVGQVNRAAEAIDVPESEETADSGTGAGDDASA